MSRASVFIDGNNWYFKLRQLLDPVHLKPRLDFDIRGLRTNLVAPDDLTDVRYYIGRVKRVRNEAHSERLYAKQQQLIAFLQKQHIAVGYGNLIPYPDGKFHEKGVDILLAVNMIRFAREDAYDVAYLVSSDTDLVPAVTECQRLGKQVVYVGSSLHGQSFGLTRQANRTILLQTKDVAPYLPPILFP